MLRIEKQTADQPGGDARRGVPAYEQSVIEEALGDDAASVLPEALRLVELRPRVPRYQREMLHYFAGLDGTSVNAVLVAVPGDLERSTGAPPRATKKAPISPARRAAD